MVIVSKLTLFDILRREKYWSKALTVDLVKCFKCDLEDKLCISLRASVQDLNKLRSELFRLRKAGLFARIKGGVQFSSYKEKLSRSKFSWDVEINRHESAQHVEKLQSVIIEKDLHIKDIEQKFAEYVQTQNENVNKLKRKLVVSEEKFDLCKRKRDNGVESKTVNVLKDSSNTLQIKSKSNGGVRKTEDTQLPSRNTNVPKVDTDMLTSLIYILDAFRVSQRAYHEISMLFPTLPRSYTIADVVSRMNSSYNITPTPDGDGVQQSLRDSLQRILSSHTDFVGETVKLKISGDGTRVGKKIHIFNFGFNIVNAGFSDQTTYPLVISRIKESYDDIKSNLANVIEEINALQNSFLLLGERRVGVSICLGGDYTFLLTAVGISSIAAAHVCVYCKCSKSEMKNLSLNWSMLDQSCGARGSYECSPSTRSRRNKNNFSITHDPLFSSIKPTMVVIDHLHLFLRVTDKLFNLLVSELRTLDNIREQSTFASVDRTKLKHLAALESFLTGIGIPFEVSINRDTKKLQFRDLQGPEKLTLLQKFQAHDLITNSEKASDIQFVWEGFREINTLLKTDSPEADVVAKKTKMWGQSFVMTFQCRDITPYIHNMIYHVPELLRLHESFVGFSQQGLEKLNDNITKNFFSASNHKGIDSWMHVMQKQNRLLQLASKRRQPRSYNSQKRLLKRC